MTTQIAIVGIAAELPSGSYSDQNLDHSTFFEFLLDGGEAYEDIPAGRFNVAAWKGKGAGQISVDKGTFLKDIDMFDNLEFGISSKDARTMAPSTKKLLENSFLALLDSGIDYRTKNIGCYTSGIVWDLTSVTDPDEFDATGSFAGYPSMIANRVSYHLDLLGPSVPTDTACSSSITAMHLAVQAISHGECEAAVVAGCQLNYRFIDWIQYSQGSLLAKDGKCKPFDASADGFSRGEGVVAVVIKPLMDALRDHDNIYGTILGTAINSGGAGAPPGAPLADAQCEAMKLAFKRARRKPQEVDFVECHATGTAKGDPTETNWVAENYSREDELLVGSVKGNIGHLEITAFLASLSKVCSIFKHGIIPPNVNFTTRNPAIKWDEYNLRVPTEPTPLPCHSSNKKHIISMASSGIGGANGHIVLESPPVRPPLSWCVGGIAVDTVGKRIPRTHPVLLMAGGLSPRSAITIADAVVDLARQDNSSNLSIMSTVLGRRAKQMTWRSYTVLNPESDDVSPVKFSQASLASRIKPPIVFVFCGQGPQHSQMGRELFYTFPVFRNSILEMDEVFTRVTGKSIVNDYGLFGSRSVKTLESSGAWSASLVFPSIAIYQMALFDLLISLGVKPDYLVGHSAGETAVLYASGAGSKAMAVELSIARGHAYAAVEKDDGTMAAMSCGPQEGEQLLKEARRNLNPGDIVEVACHNSPSAIALAGKNKAIDHVIDIAQSRGILCRKIRTRVPNHSSMMEGCRDVYCERLRDVFERYPGPHVPTTPVYSTLTGERFFCSFDANYFWKNARNQVRFTQAIQSLSTSNASLTFAEVAPHPVLSAYMTSMVPGTSSVLSIAKRPKMGQASLEHNHFLRFMGELTVLGHNCVDFTALNGRACYEGHVSLPSYPFMRKHFPLYPDSEGYAKQMEPHNGPLNHKHLKISKESHSSLAEHVIRGESIMPAAGFLEMALEFGATMLVDVNLRSILSLPSERPTKVSLELHGSYWSVKSASAVSGHRETSQPERLHADGYLSFEPLIQTYPKLDLAKIRSRCASYIESAFYPSLAYFSTYGPLFRRVIDVFYSDDEALVSIDGLDDALMYDADYCLHPAILDACFHLTAFKPFNGNYDPNAYYLPARVGCMLIHQPLKKGFFPPHLLAYYSFKHWSPDTLRYDIVLVDEDGERLCTLESFEVAKHHFMPYSEVIRRFDVVLQPACHSARIPTNGRQLPEGTETAQLYHLLDKLALEAQGIQATIPPDCMLYSDDDYHLMNGYTVDVPGENAAPSVHGTNGWSVMSHPLNGNGQASYGVPELSFGSPSGVKAVDENLRRGWLGRSGFMDMQFNACQALSANLRLKWPSHFELIDERKSGKHSASSIDSSAYSPHPNFLMDECTKAIRNTFTSFFFGNKRRLIRLFITGDNFFVRNRLPTLLTEFPSLFFDIFICNASNDLDVDPQSAVCRIGEFDFASSVIAQHLDINSFDAVLDFNSLPSHLDLSLIIRVFHELLVPGGSLIVTEKNGSAWETNRPGTEWCNFVFDTPDSLGMISLDNTLGVLSDMGFSTLSVLDVKGADPFHFTVECQKLTSSEAVHTQPLYNDSESFTFEYRKNEELDLQWAFSGLDPMQELDIWILAVEGQDGDAAMGLIRGIRREMLHWKIRLVIFPASFTFDMQQETLQKLPQHLCHEPEIIVSPQGELFVPRMVPSAPPDSQTSFATTTVCANLPEHHVVIRILNSSCHDHIFAFAGSVIRSSASGFEKGNLVIGVHSSPTCQQLTIDSASICLVPSGLASSLALLTTQLAGFAVAFLALSQSLLRRPDRLARMRILLTHSSTSIGRAVSRFCALRNVNIIEIPDSSSILDLTQQGLGSMDIVISGYVDRSHVQILRRLLHPGRGRLFLWDDEDEGLIGILKKNPWTLGDALYESLLLMDGLLEETIGAQALLQDAPLPIQEILNATEPYLFDSTKTYLLLGGIGSLGAQIALWMYERGARSLVLTSRSGQESLGKTSNLMPRRLFKYLETCSDLRIRLEAVDGTSFDGMKLLIDALPTPLGGCMVLTAVTADRLFTHLSEEDFSTVFSAKTGVMEVLIEAIDVASLDFLVAFSSVSGAFGVAGQTNYDAANSALDGLTAQFSNAFSFVAPGISDTSLMLAGGIDEQSPLLNHFIEWAMSAEEMIRWLEDGIRKIFSGHEMWLYIPDLDWEALHRTLGMTKLGFHLVPLKTLATTTLDDGTDKIAELVMKILNIPLEEFSYEVPLTAYGLDSLSASRLSFSLHSTVEVSQIQLLADMTFNDILQKSANVTRDVVAHDSETSSLQRVKVQMMKEMVSKYTCSFPVRPVDLTDNRSNEQVILLTGTTGALGANILAHLVDSPDSKLVYAFNRPSQDGVSLIARQKRRLKNEGLSPLYADCNKVVLIEGDASLPDLGIDSRLMEQLLTSVTHIMHNAWRVDVIAPLAAFEDLIQSTRRLLELTLQSKLVIPPSFSFISTIGVYRHPKDPVIAPEGPIEDPSISIESGYIESKWVAEQIVQKAATMTPIRTTVIRVGQLAGGVNGGWNTSEWVPSMVKSGLFLGCLPGGDDTLSWMPVHLAAAVVAEMRDAPPGTFHVVHPRPVTWNSVFKPLASLINVPLVTYSDWFARLKDTIVETGFQQESSRNPALRLLDFFRLSFDVPEHLRPTKECMGLLPKVLLEKSKTTSKTLSDENLPQLGPAEVQMWVKYWRDIDYLPPAV